MRICISGAIGSGKSSVAKIIAQNKGLKYHYIGELMRIISAKEGIPFSKFHNYAEKNPRIDKELDDLQKELAKEDNFVLDSRLGYYFIKDSYKIFLKADTKTAAERILKHNREEEKYNNIEEAEIEIKKRRLSEIKRYKQLYGINFPDEKDFDLVIDTTKISIKQVVDIIMKKIS